MDFPYRPTFKSESYVAEIPENSQEGVPVTFMGSAIPEVYDHDLVRKSQRQSESLCILAFIFRDEPLMFGLMIFAGFEWNVSFEDRGRWGSVRGNSCRGNQPSFLPYPSEKPSSA